jgi:hypothetical protein
MKEYTQAQMLRRQRKVVSLPKSNAALNVEAQGLCVTMNALNSYVWNADLCLRQK